MIIQKKIINGEVVLEALDEVNAQAEAIAAKVDAETAKTAAETAKTDSEAARDAAQTAKTDAETASSAASTSETNAAASASTATSKAAEATSSASAALTSKNDAETAQAAAETAKGEAETARDEAQTAATDAENAQTAAETAKSDSETAKDLSVSAKNDAQQARDEAVSAKDISLSAASSATISATQVLNALGGLEKIENSPNGFNYNLPFTLYYNGEYFLVDPIFDLESYAGITVNKTYYVNSDPLIGNDSNDGLTPATALRTLNEANSRSDAQRVIIAENSYFYKNERPTQFSGSYKIIGLGSGSTRPWITNDITNQIGPFSQVSNYYQASIDYVQKVYDFANLDEHGKPQSLTAVSSIAEVDSTPGSFYHDVVSDMVYVRTEEPDGEGGFLPGREPDANLSFFDSLTYRLREDNATQYIENIIFFGGAVQMQSNSIAGGTKAYFKNCLFWGSLYPHGLDEVGVWSCVVDNFGGDCFNYDWKNYGGENVIKTKGFEYNAIPTNRKKGDTTSQASTSHNGCEIVRINGVYYDTAGQNIADVTGSQTWILGARLSGSETGVGFRIQDGGNAWLDRVRIYGNSSPLETAGGSKIFYNKLHIEEGSFGGASAQWYFE